MTTTVEEDVLDQIEATLAYGVGNDSVARGEVMWMLQQVLSCMHEQVARLKEEQIEEAINSAMQLVYDDKNLFDGYDLNGYLTRYVQEMELQNVPEGRMIEVFANLVTPDFNSRVQEIQTQHGESWKDFEAALKCEFMDHFLEEEFEFQSKDLGCTDLFVTSEVSMPKHDHTTRTLQDVPSCASYKCILITIDTTIDECHIDKVIPDVVHVEPYKKDIVKENQDIYEYRDGQVVEDVRRPLEAVYKVCELSQDGMQKQVQEGLDHEGIPTIVECVYEVDIQFINYLGNDESKLVDARLLHMPFDAGGRYMRCKIGKILLIPFDPGGKTLNLSLLQACNNQSAVRQGYVDFLKEALVTIYRMQNEGISHDAMTIGSVLKACVAMGQEQDLVMGARIFHPQSRGDSFAGKSLVDRYVMCGGLPKAQQVLEKAQVVFETLSYRSVVPWNALIAGYAKHGHGVVILKYFEHMKLEGVLPDAITFTCSLKACGSVGALSKGQDIHCEITKKGLLKTNLVADSVLVDLYVKCGYLASASFVFNMLAVWNIMCWNALISGYAENGRLACEGWNCLEAMLPETVSLDVMTFACILKACAALADVQQGNLIHEHVVRCGFNNDLVVGITLIHIYTKCQHVKSSRKVFDRLQNHNVLTWNALIAGYTQQGQSGDALNCFEQMQREGLSPDVVTFTCILKACGSIGAAEKGKEMHVAIVPKGFLENESMARSALVDMYAKGGALLKAREVFDELPTWYVVSWTVLRSRYCQYGHSEHGLNCYEKMKEEGLSANAVTASCILKACGILKTPETRKQIHDEIITGYVQYNNDTMLGAALVDMDAKCGALKEAQDMFDEFKDRGIVSWPALIGGYTEHGLLDESMTCIDKMQLEGILPDPVMFLCILKACGGRGAKDRGCQVHMEFIQEGFEHDLSIGNALVDMYGKCGLLTDAQEVFEDLAMHDIVSWNTLSSGYTQHGLSQEAYKCWEEMLLECVPQNRVSWNTIIQDKAEQGEHEQVFALQVQMQGQGLIPDIVTLVSVLAASGDVVDIIVGDVECGLVDEALKCYKSIQDQDLFPDAIICIYVLKACCSVGAAEKGETIFAAAELDRLGLLNRHLGLGRAFVGTNAKCGSRVKLQQLFERFAAQNTVVWIALIVGFADHGLGEKSLPIDMAMGSKHGRVLTGWNSKDCLQLQ